MAQKERLSHKLIDSLSSGDGRRYVYDADVPNLCVCVLPSGRKSFYWVGRASGVPSRIFLGVYPQKSLERARVDAKQVSADAASRRPVSIHADAKASITLVDVFEDWWKNHSIPHKKTWMRDHREFELYLSGWGSKRLSLITKQMIASHHVRIGSERGRYSANKMLELLKSLYNHAISQMEWKGENAAKSVKRFSAQSRDRFLTSEELPRFLDAVQKLKKDVSRDFFLLCLFTGARRQNVCEMEWSHVDLSRRVWTIPGGQSKNGVPMPIMLCGPAMDILLRRNSAPHGRWVLAGRGPTGHYNEPKGAWQQIKKGSGITGIRIHDLRRTLGSWQAMSGSSLLMIAKSLGHVSTRATQIYARLQSDPVRESVEQAVAAMLSFGK